MLSLAHRRATHALGAWRAAAAAAVGGSAHAAATAAAAAAAGSLAHSVSACAPATACAPSSSSLRLFHSCSAVMRGAGAATGGAAVVRSPRRAASAPSSASSSSSSIPASSPPLPSSFAALSLSPPLLAALETLGVSTPTAIQALALPTLLAGRSALLASHTGAGKTLAYLLPLVQQLKRDESVHRVATRLGRPRALVVVPNRELAVQVLAVCKALSHQAKFRSFASTGFIPLSKLSRALEAPVDLLVVTPGRLEFLVSSGRIGLSDVRYVVLDETDTLLSGEHGFAHTIESVLLGPLQARVAAREKAARDSAAIVAASASALAPVTAAAPPAVQFIFCSASITPAIESALASGRFPSLVRLHTPSLHHLPPALVMRNELVGNKDKADMLWTLLQRESENYKRRLMHHRTREQNRKDLAELGGDERLLWERLVEQDCGARGVPLQHVQAADAAAAASERDRASAGKLIRGQLDFNEADQEDDSTKHRPRSAAEEEEERHEEQEQGEQAADNLASPSSSSSVYLPLPPTLIFCNTVSSCRAVAHLLTERGLTVGHYHGLMPSGYRTAHFKNFLSGATNVLVATDLASRGLDTTFVQHVVHFDFPFSVLDFIHRVGRTARNGAKGKSTGLLEKKDRVLAEAIERLSSKGLSIEQLTADKQRYGPDGLPLSAVVYESQQERAASGAAAAASAAASASADAPSVTSDGVKQLSSARRAAKRPALRPGEQPRRRWMRYMAPSARNEHKLLYAHKHVLHPSQHMRPSARDLRREESGTTAAVDGTAQAQQQQQQSRAAGRRLPNQPSARATDPAYDPFAFSSPYGRNRNATNPAEAAAVQAASKAAQAAQREANKAQGRTKTAFPAAPGALKRTAAARPLGPLAHKQKVGAIFAASPSSGAPQRVVVNHQGQSTTSGAAKRREARARAAVTGAEAPRKGSPRSKDQPKKMPYDAHVQNRGRR